MSEGLRHKSLAIVLTLVTITGLASCFGGGEETAELRSELSRLQTQISSSPTPPPDPTADPAIELRTRVAVGIRASMGDARRILEDLEIGTIGAKLGQPFAYGYESWCNTYTDRFEDTERGIGSYDLWPPEYKAVNDEVRRVCRSIDLITFLHSSNPSALEDYYQPLADALVALPDHSFAQLLRAIEERQ